MLASAYRFVFFAAAALLAGYVCADTSTVFTNFGAACTIDSTCGTGLECDGGKCHVAFKHQCDGTHSCSTGHVCSVSGVIGETPLMLCRYPYGHVCDDVEDCANTMRCDGGKCMQGPGGHCGPNSKFTCASGLTCQDNGNWKSPLNCKIADNDPCDQKTGYCLNGSACYNITDDGKTTTICYRLLDSGSKCSQGSQCATYICNSGKCA